MAEQGTKIADLQINIKTNAGTATKQLKKFNDALQITKIEAGSTSELVQTSKAMQDLEKAEEKLSPQTDKVTSKMSKLKESVKKTGESIKTSTAKSSTGIGKLVSQFARLAGLKLMRTVVMKVFQDIGEAINNVYHYSQLLNSTDSSSIADNFDSIATSLAQVKNNLGAMAGQLLANLAPVLTTILSYFNRLVEAASMWIAALTGHSTYTKAKALATSWDDTADSVSSSANEMKASLLGIDEINALSDNSDSGSGSGSSDSTNYGDMFEEAEISQDIQKIVKKLQPILDKLKEIGEFINPTLTLIAETFYALITGNIDGIYDAAFNWLDKMRGTWVGDLLATASKLGGKFLLLYNEVDYKVKQIALKVTDAVLHIKLKILEFLDWLGIDVDDAITNVNNEIATTEKAMDKAEENYNTVKDKVNKTTDLLVAYFSNSTEDIHNDIANQLNNTEDDFVLAMDYLENSYGVTKEWLEENYPEITADAKLAMETIDAIGMEYAVEKNGIEDDSITVTAYADVSNVYNSITGVITRYDGSTITLNVKARTTTIEDDVLGSTYREYGWSGRYTEFASGGYPDTGSMFIAGEAGAELVGNINGRTGVASQGEITGIKNAVLASGNEESSLLREQNSLLKQLVNKSGNVTVSTSALLNGLARENRRTGKTVVAMQY